MARAARAGGDLDGAVSPGDRLLAVARLVAEHPGIGREELLEALEVETGRAWGAATLFADLKKLRAAGILAPGPHRDGYFLAGPSFSDRESRGMLGALRMLSDNLRSPLATDLYRRIEGRLARSRSVELLAYPVEAIGNRVVLDTSHEDYRELVRELEKHIRRGQEVIIRKIFHPWEETPHKEAVHHVVPLQFLFHDVAWYLLAEDRADGQFKVFRLDRLDRHICPTGTPARGSARQLAALQEAHALLELAWGVLIPPRGTRQDDPDLVPVQVKFDAFAARFIRESLRRHPTQSIRKSGEGIVFSARLPECALEEFGRWVFSWGPHARVLEPVRLRMELAGRFAQAADLYRNG